MPMEGGNRPLRACGTRFIAHKVVALARLVDHFGPYISHLTSLTEDVTVRPADRQKITGYIRKWRNAKMLIGCAYFHDVLKPMATLCKALQADEVCVVHALEWILKASKNVQKMKDTDVGELPMVKKVLSRVNENNGTFSYQGADLVAYADAIAYFRAHHQEYSQSIEACLKQRMSSQETDMLTHALTVLATQGWERSETPSFGYPALEYLSERFAAPLQHANIDTALLQGEWDNLVGYGKDYLNLATEENNVIWWKLFNSPSAKEWANILGLVEMLFCLPMSNGHLERVFSQLKLIKTNRRNCLSEDRLDSLVRIATTGPPLKQWDAGNAVELWWSDKKRRNVGEPRGLHAQPTSGAAVEDRDPSTSITLEDWERWIEE